MQERQSALRSLERRRRFKRKRRIAIFLRTLTALIFLSLLGFIIFGAVKLLDGGSGEGFKLIPEKQLNVKTIDPPDYVDVQLITNPMARKGTKLKEINSVVVHYTGNPKTTAQNNRDYFDNFGTTVCSHFVIGVEGEIIQCVPINEKSAASNHRNSDTISIEVCHTDDSGKFSDSAYSSLIKLLAWLCDNSGLDSDDIIRHYDVTGKLCPLYYVENEDKWDQLKEDVKSALGEYQ